MAGETPNAARSRDAQKAALRKRFDTKTTDQYYRSGDVSALGRHHGGGDSYGRPGDVPKPIPTPKLSDNDKNADKYYQNNRKQSFPKSVGQLRPLQAKQQARQARRASRETLPAGYFNIDDRGAINGVLMDVCSYVSNDTPATVVVPHGDRKLMQRVRAAVDLLMTREVINEDQGTSIKLVYGKAAVAEPSPTSQAPVPALAVLPLPTIFQQLGPPEPRGEVSVDEADELAAALDPAAVLAGDIDVSEKFDTTPLPVVEDTVAEDDEDADNLLPGVDLPGEEPKAEPPADRMETVSFVPTLEFPGAAAADDLLPEVPPAIEPPPAATEPRRRGKRAGRGSDA